MFQPADIMERRHKHPVPEALNKHAGGDRFDKVEEFKVCAFIPTGDGKSGARCLC